MKDGEKKREQLIDELESLRQKIDQLEAIQQRNETALHDSQQQLQQAIQLVKRVGLF